MLEFSANQAGGHRDVIARFGRHPHRNEILERQSTPEELEYLATGQLVHTRPLSANDCDSMKQPHPLRVVLSELNGSLARQLELFALVNLGLVQSMASGVLTPTEAVERFYHARNCLYVQKHFRRKEAQIIMSRGVQLPDLFDCLPPRRHSASFTMSLRQCVLSV